MKMTKYAGAGFIKIDDVRAKPHREQIAVVKEDDRFGKPVLVFESGKMVSLNKTSVGAHMNEFGEDSESWLSQFVEIYAGQVKYQGATMDAVLVRRLTATRP